MPVHDGGRKTGELFRALRFYERCKCIAAPSCDAGRCECDLDGRHDHAWAALPRVPRARVATALASALAATCNGFRRVDRVGCELVKY